MNNMNKYQNVQDYRLFQKIMEKERKGGGGGTTSPPPQTKNEQGNWTIEQRQQAHEAIKKANSSNLYNFLDRVKKNQPIERKMKDANPKRNTQKEPKEVSYQDKRTPEERNEHFMEIDPGQAYDTALFDSLPEIEQTRDNSRKSARETTRDLLALVQGQGENDSAEDLTEDELRTIQEIERMEFHDYYTGEDGTFGEDTMRPEDKIVLDYADRRQKEGTEWFEENRKDITKIVQNVDQIYEAYTERGYQKDSVSFDEAINYSQGYFSEEDLRQFTAEQLEQLEIYAMLLQTHDSALQYITRYGENDIYTYEYVRELNQKMDDIVKYNPNAGDKVAYYTSEFTSGMVEFFEIGGRYAYALGTEIVACFQGSNTEKKEAIRQAGKDAISGPLWVDGWRDWAKKTFSATDTDIMIGGVLQGLGNATSSSLIGGAWGIGLNALNTAGKGARAELANGADYDSAMLIGGLQGLLDAGMSKAMGGFGIKDINGNPQNLAGLMAEKLCSSDFGKFIGKSMINAALDEGVEALGMYVTPYLRRATYDPNAEPLSDEQFAEAVLMGYLTKTVTNLALSYPGFLKGLKKANAGEAIDIPDEANEEADKAMGKLKERAEQIGALETAGESKAPQNQAGALGADTSRMAGEAGDNRGALGDDAEIPGRQGGEREPLMLPAPEERKMLPAPEERKMLPAAEERKMLPAGEERKLLPSGESDEKTMMAAFEGNTGQSQPIGVDAEIPAVTKAGEIPLIEGVKDKTAEGMAKMVADENGVPLPTQTAQSGVTTGASAGNSDILESTGTEVLQYKPATEDIRVKLEKAGLSQEKGQEIIALSKAEKPLPETYLSKTYIDEHLKVFKDSGAVKILPTEPKGTIGGKGGIFVLSEKELQDIIKLSNGDIRYIEKALGMDLGYLGENPVIVRFDSNLNIRMPQGNELGADPKYWMPGGYTSGGIMEAVIDPAKPGTYTYQYLFK